MISLLMFRFTLDTFCVIAAAQGERYGDQIDGLVDLARAGHGDLWLTTAYTYDQSTASNGNRRKNLQWLSRRQPIGTVPGPFRLDLSPLGGPDLLVSEATGVADERIKAILLSERYTTGKLAPGRKIHDVHHLTAHLMAGHDAFITNDRDMLDERQELLSQVSITVLDPVGALVRATESSGPTLGTR